MTAGPPEWTCVGARPAHPADLETVETRYRSANSELAIRRCRTCGQLYRHSMRETHDWSNGNDYCDVTNIWTAIDADEVEAIREDANYEPRAGVSYRHDTGWQRE